MICFAEAQSLIPAHCRLLPMEVVAAAAAFGRVLAKDIHSPGNLPPFDNSAMDGFALASGTLTLEAGREFAVCGEQSAGEGWSQATVAGAWEIMTGARMPDGLDTVVPVEQAAVLARDAGGRPLRIRLTAPVPPQQHVRSVGQDIAAGALAIGRGQRIGPAEQMLLAGLGVASVPVVRRPQVAIVCTGRELVDEAAIALQPGQIRNSNGPFLAVRLPMAGAETVRRETVPDDDAAFKAALARALAAGAEMVVSTGAVSIGRHDFIPPSLRAMGADLVFHRVAIRPGKPLLFGTKGDVLVFGLPGNPVSSLVGFELFVKPALTVMRGRETASKEWKLKLTEPLTANHDRPTYHPAVITQTATDRTVKPLAWFGAAGLRGLLAANGFILLPPGEVKHATGDTVPVLFTHG